MSNTHTTTNELKNIDPQVLRDYRNGWRSSAKSSCGLEAADARGVSNAWYDGYSDEACGRSKYHKLFCDSMTGHDACEDIPVKGVK